jgi:hypothetical protein
MRPGQTGAPHRANDRGLTRTSQHSARPGRRPLDGPVIVQPATHGGQCAVCASKYPAGTAITWLTGSGPAHAQCAPPVHQAEAMRAAAVLAGQAASVAELREWLAMCGLVREPPRRRTRGRP